MESLASFLDGIYNSALLKRHRHGRSEAVLSSGNSGSGATC